MKNMAGSRERIETKGVQMDKLNIEKLGYDKFYEENYLKAREMDEGLVAGRVTAVHRERYQVITEYGEGWSPL